MTDSARPEDAPPPAPAAKPAASRWARLWGLLKRFRGPIVAIAAFGAVLSGLLGYWRAYETVQTVVVPKSAPPAIAVDAGPLSIVVLPFTNLTGDANQAYVADGLTASLTTDLSRIRDAFIVDAKTAFAYKDKPVTAQQVGKDLGVHFVLQGSVQHSGTKIRINAQLADTTSNAQMWSESFEGDQSDLFALQDRVTTLVGNSIGREMVIAAARESESRKSSPKASDLILRARAVHLKDMSLENEQQQEDLYRQALALEPNNASAMVTLASVLAAQAGSFINSQLDESSKEKKYAEGRDLVAKAKKIDPDNPEIYMFMGADESQHGDLAGSQRAFETWLSLEPKDPSVYNDLADLFYFKGEPRRAIDMLTKGIALNPRHPLGTLLHQMCRTNFMLGDNDATIESCLKALDSTSISPADAYSYLAMAYAAKGEDAKARAAAAEVRRLDDPLIKLSQGNPEPWQSAAYKEWRENKLVPAWRKAGLPE
jgi:TolB-like protein/Flp pilus assembly protein TadD